MAADKPHESGWGKGLTPTEIALWSSLIGGAGGFLQGKMLYDDPKLVAAKTTFGALGSAGLGYALAKLNPALKAMYGMVPTSPVVLPALTQGQAKAARVLEAYAEGFFEVWERSLEQ